ncbi:MAG: GAF domain-containing protein [Rhodospirillales bacterium]|jgi:two-component sensor histidine kinase|nr:GAF domain-containing protein [Rhodospirillales bacterium]
MAEADAQRHHRLERFGETAARAPDVDALLQRACQEVAEALRVSHVKALEYLPDRDAFLIRAGVGWAAGVVGEVVVGFDSPPGYTLATGQPANSADLSKENRFHIPKVLLDHGVKSMANVLIRTGDTVFGVLEADNDRRRKFGERDTELLQGFANVLALVLAQAKLAAENRELSEKKELLLRELTHRTKNNNQMLMSMICLHRMKATAPEAQRALESFENRIRLMAAIDDMLALDEETDDIDVPLFLGAVAGKAFAAMSDKQRETRLVLELQDGTLSRRQAQALAIITNEFITNSCKYAFASGGRLSVSANFAADAAVVEMADDGPGVPADAAPGLGTHIIEAMARQMRAGAEWSTQNGTRLRLFIPRQDSAVAP